MEVKIKSKSAKIFNWCLNIFVAAFLVVIIYPLWYVICVSFSNYNQVLETPFLIWPVDFTLDSYKMVMEYTPIWRGFVNSFLYMFVGTAINVVITMISAYPLTKDGLFGREVFSKILVISMYVTGGMIPSYLVVDALGMVNTLWAIVIPVAVNVYMIILARNFMRSTLPQGIEEAARVDGASYFRTFFYIVLPLSKPLIALLCINFGLGHWNSYTSALIYLNDEELRPLQLVLRDIIVRMQTSAVDTQLTVGIDYGKLNAMREGFKYSTIVISSVPILCIFPFVRKYFEKGLMVGGVKE